MCENALGGRLLGMALIDVAAPSARRILHRPLVVVPSVRAAVTS